MINLIITRKIPEGTWIHRSVFDRRDNSASRYKPKNLPDKFKIIDKYPRDCLFAGEGSPASAPTPATCKRGCGFRWMPESPAAGRCHTDTG